MTLGNQSSFAYNILQNIQVQNANKAFALLYL